MSAPLALMKISFNDFRLISALLMCIIIYLIAGRSWATIQSLLIIRI